MSHPLSGKPEVRVLKLVVSSTGAGINAPFSVDLTAPTPFHILRLPPPPPDVAAAAAAAEAARTAADSVKFGEWMPSAKGVVTYTAKTAGVTRKVEVAAGDTTRGDLLDMRASAKRDRFC